MARLWGRDFTRDELAARTGQLAQVAGVRLVTLGDGAERGVRVLEFRTGSGFEFDVLVDRGFDVARCEHAGRALGWHSQTGFPGPWYHEPEGFGFFRLFGGGLLTTGGLDHALGPATDTAEQYLYPDIETASYGLHGRLTATPARLAGYGERWEGDECVLWALGEVVQAAVFGEQLVLRRRVEARVGESRLTVSDEVENVGYTPTPHMFLYHVNVGFPVVDDGAQAHVPAIAVEPGREHGVGDYTSLEPPRRGYVEQVYQHEMAAETGGHVPVAVVNPALGLGVYEVYRNDQLPHHLLWRMLGRGNFVVGIEPSTNRMAGRLDARERGELIELDPGERRAYELELGALVGAAEIDSFTARVAALTT